MELRLDPAPNAPASPKYSNSLSKEHSGLHDYSLRQSAPQVSGMTKREKHAPIPELYPATAGQPSADGHIQPSDDSQTSPPEDAMVQIDLAPHGIFSTIYIRSSDSLDNPGRPRTRASFRRGLHQSSSFALLAEAIAFFSEDLRLPSSKAHGERQMLFWHAR